MPRRNVARTPIRSHMNGIAEDDRLRSNYVRQLVQATGTRCSTSDGDAIPRVICQFWHDRTGLPLDVRECLDSWVPLLARGFERLLFDDDDALRFIAQKFPHSHVAAFERCQHPAMRSDY